MTVTCVKCRPKRLKTFPAQWVWPESSVIESRKKPAHTTLNTGKVIRTLSIVRRRECKQCGWRWQTVEIQLIPKYRSGGFAHAKRMRKANEPR